MQLNNRIFFIMFCLLWGIVSNLAAHVTIDYPKGGETFTIGNTVSIKWIVEIDHGESDWDILFSGDRGETWDTLKADLDKMNLEYNWVPDSVTSLGMIRVVQNNVMGLSYYSDSDVFTVLPLSTATHDSRPSIISRISLSPNPFRGQTMVHFHLAKPGKVLVEVFDLKNSQQFVLIDKSFLAGTHGIPWDAGSLPQGIYACRVTVESTSRSTLMIKLE